MDTQARPFGFIAACTLTLSLSLSTGIVPSEATLYSWIGGSGSWNDPASWSPNGTPNSSALDEIAVLTFSDSVDRVIDGVSPVNDIYTGNTGTGQLIWNVSQGTNMDCGYACSGTSVWLGSGTTLNMTGGYLTSEADGFWVASGAVINQSGGTINGMYNLSIDGVYNLSEGSMHGYWTISNTGTINQTGGEIGVSSGFFSNIGTYNFYGGNEEAWIRNTGVFNVLSDATADIAALSMVSGGVLNVSGRVYIDGLLDLGVFLDGTPFDGTITNIYGTPGSFIYYDPTYSDGYGSNAYLGGRVYQLQGHGLLMPVPEPSTLLLLGPGLAGLGGMAWRRHRKD